MYIFFFYYLIYINIVGNFMNVVGILVNGVGIYLSR